MDLLLVALIGAIVNMIIGSVWYSPLMFGNIWKKLAEVDTSRGNKNMGQLLFNSFAASVASSMSLIWIMLLSNADQTLKALYIGVILGMGVSAMTAIQTYIYERRPMGLWFINYVYPIVSFALQAMLFTKLL